MSTSGGGGGSGQVDFPDYMKEIHEDWLRQSSDTINSSMTDIMNAALVADPYDGKSAYNPTTAASEITAAADYFFNVADLLSCGTSLCSIISNVLSDDRITDSVNAFTNDLDVQMNKTTLARFKAGMRSINAVYSSAFVGGMAFIEAQKARDVAKFTAALKVQQHSADALKVVELYMTFQKAAADSIIEANRMKIVAMKEYTDKQLEVDIGDAVWELEVFQHGANLLGAIGGGTAVPGAMSRSNPIASALGGALSGAAAGFQMSGGNPAGAILGGAIGIGMSLFN